MMGCLFELFFDIFLEGVFTLFGYCYIKLMQLIVPNKTISERTKSIIKNTVAIIAGILGIILIIGLIFMGRNNPSMNRIGKYMTYIPLALIVVQIVLGIIVRIIDHFKK